MITVFRIAVYNLNFQLPVSSVFIDSFKFTLCRVDSILLCRMLSIILSCSSFNTVTINNKTATLILLILLCSFMTILFTVSEENIYLRNGGFIFTNLVCVCTELISIKNPGHFLLSNKLLRWLGIRSYGIYVYHFPIFMLFEGLRIHHSMANYLMVTALRFAVTILIAELSYRYIEQPFLRFKKKLYLSRSL